MHEELQPDGHEVEEELSAELDLSAESISAKDEKFEAEIARFENEFERGTRAEIGAFLKALEECVKSGEVDYTRVNALLEQASETLAKVISPGDESVAESVAAEYGGHGQFADAAVLDALRQSNHMTADLVAKAVHDFDPCDPSREDKRDFTCRIFLEKFLLASGPLLTSHLEQLMDRHCESTTYSLGYVTPKTIDSLSFGFFVSQAMAQLSDVALPLIDERLSRDDPQVLSHTLDYVKQIGKPAEGLTEKVDKLLDHPEGFVRVHAVEALSAIGAPAVGSVDKVLRLAQNDYGEVADYAVKCLGRIGAPAEVIIPALSKIIKDELRNQSQEKPISRYKDETSALSQSLGGADLLSMAYYGIANYARTHAQAKQIIEETLNEDNERTTHRAAAAVLSQVVPHLSTEEVQQWAPMIKLALSEKFTSGDLVKKVAKLGTPGIEVLRQFAEESWQAEQTEQDDIERKILARQRALPEQLVAQADSAYKPHPNPEAKESFSFVFGIGGSARTGARRALQQEN